jgi:hypothetical protein
MILVVIMIQTTSADMVATNSNVLFRQAMIFVVIITAFVVINVLVGADTNDMYREHMKALIYHMGVNSSTVLNCEEKIQALTKSSAISDEWKLKLIAELSERITKCNSLLNALVVAKDTMEHSNELHSVRVFGIECSYSYAYSICTAVGTFFAYLIAAVQSSALNSQQVI